MSELKLITLVFTGKEYEKWRKGDLYRFNGWYGSGKHYAIPKNEQPQMDVLYTVEEVLRFLEAAGDHYDEDNCYICDSVLSFLDEDDTAEYSKKNLEYFLRQTTYEFVSAEMWDEDNTMEYEYGQRVHKKRVLHAPGGDVLAVVEVACEETW